MPPKRKAELDVEVIRNVPLSREVSLLRELLIGYRGFRVRQLCRELRKHRNTYPNMAEDIDHSEKRWIYDDINIFSNGRNIYRIRSIM